MSQKKLERSVSRTIHRNAFHSISNGAAITPPGANFGGLQCCMVYLASSGAATQAANDGGGGPIPPLAATFGSFARQRSNRAIN
ncbi:hypothetical protein PCASD_03956 [Puccinia coronata f. sp. avenae]|uniref:Uncharacterized protein n=1 Tax=Puccinia coronata f. sp. avenae TaxID=200324 RepID=A0A2N5VAN9_9BASI|nr:hypothetical protein PCASD_03956 [Puccinia coronata f. sp. avenae]